MARRVLTHPRAHTGGTSSDARLHDRAAPVRHRRGNLKAPRRPGDRWGVEFSLHGERHYVSFPGSADGARERAEREREFVMEKVNRGEWAPAADPAPALAAAAVPRYADVAAEALARQVKRLEPPGGRRARELEYQLSIGL